MSQSSNTQPAVRQQPKFSVAITTKGFQQVINNTLRDPQRANRFVAAITSAVANSPELQKCDAGTILAGALLGESLNLSPSPQLGQYYLVPFKAKAKYDKSGALVSPEMTKAQFILGYKGYIQLAIRSGQYRKLNVLEIKQGELVHFDALNEELDVVLIEDYAEREAAPTIGYYAMFEYINGFRKALYWSKEKMMTHADRYSPAFSARAYEKLQRGEIPEKDLWKYSSFWYKNFDDMAKKTMLRQIISRWGVMSSELLTAYEKDSSIAAIDQTGDIVASQEEAAPPTTPENEQNEPGQNTEQPETIESEVVDIDSL